MARIQISNDPSGRIIVSFPYDSLLVSTIKTIDGRRWHPAEKHWSFPKLVGMLEKILKVFGDFINHARKNPSEIKDGDIKDYLVYLSETKGAATSTLNQAINAIKFYYGTVLKKKFISLLSQRYVKKGL